MVNGLFIKFFLTSFFTWGVLSCVGQGGGEVRSNVDSLLDQSLRPDLPTNQRRELIKKGIFLAKENDYDNGVINGFANFGVLLAQINRYDSAIMAFRKSGHLAERHSHLGAAGNAYNNLGTIYHRTGQFDSVIFYLNRAKEVFLKNDRYPYRAAHSVQNLGVLEERQGNYDKALVHFFEALKLFDKLDGVKDAAIVNNNIGLIFHATEEYGKALSYFSRSLNGWIAMRDTVAQANVMDNLGLTYLAQGQLDSASFWFERALAFNRIKLVPSQMASNLDHLASLYVKQNDFKVAQEYYESALTLQEQLGETSNQITTLKHIGELLLISGQLDSATRVLSQATELAKEKGLKSEIYESTKLGLEARLLFNNDSLSVALLKRMFNWHDSLYAEEKLRAIQEAENKFHGDKARQELALEQAHSTIQAAQIRTQTGWLIFGGILIVLVGIITVLILRASRQRKRSNETLSLANEKIEGLLHELNHRVKNQLNHIISMFFLQEKMTDDGDLARLTAENRERIEAMSLVHRKLYQVDSKTLHMRGLLSELCEKLLESYRSEQNIELKLRIEDLHLPAEDGHALALIANELITNALKYAFLKDGKAELLIRLEEKSDQIEFEISDNGVGFKSGQRQAFGLKLVEKQAENLGAAFETTFDSGTQHKLTFSKTGA